MLFIYKKVALQINAIESLDLETDSTLLIASEFQARGYHVYYYKPSDLFWKDDHLFAYVIALSIGKQRYKKLTIKMLLPLRNFDFILIRQNPPFDEQYLSTTYLLETVSAVFFINHPQAIRNVPEKLSILQFSNLIPETIVCHSLDHSKTFMCKHPIFIAKPLYSCGGDGVIKIRAYKSQDIVILKNMFLKYRFLMLQEFLPIVTSDGDKRVIIIDNVIIGAVQRIPKKRDFRANSILGGAIHRTSLGAQEKQISVIIANFLKSKNILFTGLDLLGGKLIEINVTSPTCLQALNKIIKVKSEVFIVDCIEKRITRKF